MKGGFLSGSPGPDAPAQRQFRSPYVIAALLLGSIGIAAVPSLISLLRLVLQIDPFSRDGKFQTYAAVVALGGDAVPFRDYPLYLGLLVTAVSKATTLVTSRDIVGVQIASLAVAGIAFTVTTLTLLRLTGSARAFRPMLVAALATARLSIDTGVEQPLQILLNPQNSVAGLRSFAATLAELAVLGIESRMRSGPRLWAVRAASYGLSAGVLSLWSNDFGIAAALVLTAAGTVRNTRLHGVLPGLSSAVISLVCLGVANAAVLLAFGATPKFWFDSNIVETSGSQFWLFLPIQDDYRVYSPWDAISVMTGARHYLNFGTKGGLIILSVVLALPTVVFSLLQSRVSPEWSALGVTLAVTWAGACIETFGGHYSHHYWAPFCYTVAFVPIRLFCSWRPAVDATEAGNLAWTGPVMVAEQTVLLAVFQAWVFSPAASATLAQLDRGERTAMPGLRAGVSLAVAREDTAFQRIRSVLDRCNVAAADRLIEAYPSLVGVALGSQPKAPMQSIIAVFGKQAEGRYGRYIADTGPVLASTIAGSYSPWAAWNLRARYFWYDGLLRSFRPLGRTAQHIVWLRDKAGTARHPAGCRIDRVSPESTDIIVDAGPDPAGPLARVVLTYRSVVDTRWPSLTMRGLVTAKDGAGTVVPSALDRGGSFEYGIPPNGNDLQVASVLRQRFGTIHLRSHPAGTEIDVIGCTAETIDFDPNAALPPIVDDPALEEKVAAVACSAGW